ncbi:DUF1349 domain-containing protein [Paenarthrobacter sp. NPDC092416]|uniref:DUF1349 domain-containing protein n=1 Tax=Paenarthrobacter sp. NPDC092416 TaxID=3364386 RepID=UPI00381DEDDD
MTSTLWSKSSWRTGSGLAVGIIAAVIASGVAVPANAAPDPGNAASLLSTRTVGYGAEERVVGDPSTMAQHNANRTVVDVTTFGADPSGTRDSAEAINAAVEYAKSLGTPTTLVFPCGTYDIYPEKTPKRELYVSNTTGADTGYAVKNIGVLVEGMNDVIVDGQGSVLRQHGKQTQFASIKSTNVTFKNFSTDWVAPGTVDLTVLGTGVSEGAGYRDIQVPPGTRYQLNGSTATFLGEASPYTGQPYWTQGPDVSWNGFNQVRNLATGETHRSSTPIWDGATGISELGNNRLRISYGGRPDPGGAGNVYEMRQSTRDTPGAFVWESENTDLVDLNLHYLHGFGIVSQLTRNVTVDGVRFHSADGTWRQTAGFADFIQMSGVAGKVQVINSLFDNPHDDPINVHGTYVQVKSVDRGANKVTLRYMHGETAGFPQFHVGDSLRFVERSTMLPTGQSELRVAAVEGPSGQDHNQNLTEMTLTLQDPIPAGVGVDSHVAENLTYTPEVLIAGNTFESVPTRGVLVTTPKPVLIERNHFDQMTMASIYVSGDARSWYESSGAQGLVIRGNIFDRPATTSPVIFFDPTNEWSVPGLTVHNDVSIEGNRFNLLPGTEVLRARSVSDVKFTGNAVLHYGPTTAPDPSAASSTALFRFDGSQRINLTDNQYDVGFNVRADTGDMSSSEISGTDGVGINTDNRLPVPGAVLASGFSWVREDTSRWGAVAADTVRLTSGQNGLWANQNAAVNVLLRDSGATTPTEAVVKLSGATKSSYEEAGLVFYVNDDNYVALHRKHAGGSPVIALVTETNQNPNENTQVAAPPSADIWLKVTRSAGSFTGSYSTDGTTYTSIGTITNTGVAEGAARAGVMAAGSSDHATSFELAGFSVNGTAAPFFSSVPPAPAPAAAASVAWTGVNVGNAVAPRSWFAVASSDVTAVSATITPGEANTEVRATVNGKPASTNGGRLDVTLAAGPNIVELQTLTPDGNGQTYRWAIVSLAAGVAVQPASGCQTVALTGVALDHAPVVGQPVTVNASVAPASAQLTYGWLVDGEAVAGATGRSFTPSPEHSGRSLQARVTASAGGFTPAVVTTTAVVVAPAPGLAVTATADTRCIAGKVIVTVKATNNSPTAVGIQLQSAFGEKTFASVAAGKNATHAFSTRQVSVAAGTVTVVATASTGAPTTLTVPYSATVCG